MKIKKKIKDVLFGFLLLILATGVMSNIMKSRELGKLRAQQQEIIQTDYKDIGTRQKIDRDVWQELKNINRQIQADTVVLTTSQTADTIYLDRKYGDTDYMIFVIMRSKSGTYSDYVVIPLSDSSFEITKNTADISTVQWITIHK